MEIIISEVSRIHELMNVNTDKLLLESRVCPFCDAIMKQIDDLVEMYSLKGVSSRNVNLKINELLERVKNNADLTLTEKQALNNAIERLKSSADEMGDVTKYAERARAEIRLRANVLSEIPANKVTINIKDELYNTKEFADDFVEYGGVDHVGITSAYESNIEKNLIQYQNKYPTFDEWFDGDFKIKLDDLLQKAGYTNKTFRDNIIENMRNRFKSNAKITKPWEGVSSANAAIKRPRKVGMGDETLDPKYSEKYYDLIKKTGSELTEEERAFLNAVEDWKAGKEVTNEEFEVALKKIGQTNKKTIEDLTTITKDKYNKILEKEKTGTVLTDYEKNLKSDVEKFLNGENINLKDYDFPKTIIENIDNFIKKYIRYNNKYSQLIREMVYSLDNTKFIQSDIKNTFPQFENGILPEEIKKTITDDPNLKNFFTNLEGKKYGWQVDNEEKWIPTNMLDGNTGDKTTFFRDILEEVMNKEGKKIDEFMTFNEQEQNRLLNETLKHIENNKSTFKNKLLESERYIKNSQRTIIRGDEGEEIAKNAFINNNFEIVWQGGKGNALDKLGVDMIVKTDGKHYLVSVKTIPGEFRTYPSNITGKNLIGFFQPSKINIDTGFAAYVDKNNKLIVVPPQARFSKETGEKIGEGFRKNLGWTQIEDDSVLIKNF